MSINPPIRYSEQTQLRAVEFVRRGNLQAEAATLFGTSLPSIKHWVKKYSLVTDDKLQQLLAAAIDEDTACKKYPRRIFTTIRTGRPLKPGESLYTLVDDLYPTRGTE